MAHAVGNGAAGRPGTAREVTVSKGVRAGRLLGPRSDFRVVVFAGTIVLLAAAALIAGGLGGWTGRPAHTSAAPTTSRRSVSAQVSTHRTQASEPTVDTPGQLAAWVWLLIAAVSALVLYLMFRLAWNARRRIAERRSSPQPDSDGSAADADHLPPPPEFSPGVGRAFDPRAAADAIVSCWLWVEEWAAGRGWARRSSETPTEFLGRVAGDSAAAQMLLPLYHRARFDISALDPASAISARDAALQVCGRLAESPTAVGSSPPGSSPPGPSRPGSSQPGSSQPGSSP